MTTLYRWGLPLLIVLVGVAPVRAQQRSADRDSVTVLELRRAPRSGGEGRVLRRLSPSIRERVILSDTDRVKVRRLPGGRALFFGDHGQADLPMRFEMPALRMHLDTLLGDGSRFRVHMDSMMGNRMAFRMSLDSMMGDRTAFRMHFDSLKHHMGAFRVEGRPLMRFRRGGPEGGVRRFRQRGMAPQMRFFHRDGAPGDGETFFFREGPGAPGMKRQLRIERGDDGEVIIERGGDGPVRIYRSRSSNVDEMRAPGARVESRVIRLGPDGEILEGGDAGVRVERDADGGLRIYVPAQQGDKVRAPAPTRTPSRTRPRSRG